MEAIEKVTIQSDCSDIITFAKTLEECDKFTEQNCVSNIEVK